MKRQTKKGVLKIDRKVAIRILKDLNTMVVSLDRIGSSFDHPRDCDRATVAFLDDWKIFRKLAAIRATLSDLFSDKLGRDGMGELERALQNVPYWSAKHTKPPRRRP